MASKKYAKKSLDQICKEVNATFKDNLVGKNLTTPDHGRIPFTSPRLNDMTYGGIPRGRIHEFLGEENGGKTTSALDIVANAQKLFSQEWDAGYTPGSTPKRVVYCDVETTLDEQWATMLGVNMDDLYLFRPQGQSADEIFDITIDMVESQEVGLLIIDSLGAMISTQELSKDTGEASYAGISKPLTLFCKKIAPLCNLYNTTLIGINQLRDDLKNPYNMYNTPGGRAWKFYCSTRMAFRKGDYVDAAGDKLKKSTDNPAGNKVETTIVKTKAFPPNRRTGFYTLNYKVGVDEILDLVDTGIRYGVISYGNGGWTTFIDHATREALTEDDGTPIKVQGRTNIADFLRNDEFVLNFVKEQLSVVMAGE